MMKFTTILLLVWYFMKIVNQNFLIGNLKDFNNLAADKTTDEMKEMLKDTSFVKLLLKALPEMIIGFSIGITEFFYIFFALQYGNLYITLGYFIFWMTLFIIGLLRYKFSKRKTTTKAKRFNLFVLIVNIIDFAYFGYMYYILFFA